MATTANYGWTTPDDTDLVKDGASAIRSLGTAIDTTVKSVSDASGLIHINTTSFSAVSSQSVNDVFSATYKNYLVVVSLTSSASTGLNFRVRASGTDLSTSTYRMAHSRQDPTSFNFNVFGGNPGSQISGPDAKTGNVIYVRFGLPYEAQNTQILIEGDGVSYRNVRGGGYVDNTSVYDGFTVYPSSSTFTGIVSTYAYKE